MEHVVITIARHYGSGGKTVGEMLAKELGINCYDREIIRMASDESGIAEGLFGQADEKLDNSPLRRIIKNIYDGQLFSPESEEFTSNDNLFNYQAKIVRELAQKESCVIIGRCADFILKDNPDAFSVFVHANAEFSLEKAKERIGLPDKEVEKQIAKINKYRADYYKYYTGHEWNDARNYDLCLDSSRLGFEGCVEEIKAYMQVRSKYAK